MAAVKRSRPVAAMDSDGPDLDLEDIDRLNAPQAACERRGVDGQAARSPTPRRALRGCGMPRCGSCCSRPLSGATSPGAGRGATS